MKKIFSKLRDYFCSCGIEESEYKALKKDAYVSNFVVWKAIHILLATMLGVLVINALFSDNFSKNFYFYLGAFGYSLVSAILFLFVLKKESLIAQFYIYLTIALLFVFGGFVSANTPDHPAATFMVLLVITPIFMIDRPFFMSFVLVIATFVFILWMKEAKPHDIWVMDALNSIIFCIIGIFLHTIANSVRIREFVLTKKINEQKDLDDLTGLQNKGAITREINSYLKEPNGKGLLFMLDVDKFKSINDTYGHDVGDDVIRQVGEYLKHKLGKEKVVGRFGGDEFIVFIEGNDDLGLASKLAREICGDLNRYIALPDPSKKISVTIGIAIYRGEENNYSEIFKKADIALYRAKGEFKSDFQIY